MWSVQSALITSDFWVKIADVGEKQHMALSFCVQCLSKFARKPKKIRKTEILNLICTFFSLYQHKKFFAVNSNIKA